MKKKSQILRKFSLGGISIIAITLSTSALAQTDTSGISPSSSPTPTDTSGISASSSPTPTDSSGIDSGTPPPAANSAPAAASEDNAPVTGASVPVSDLHAARSGIVFQHRDGYLGTWSMKGINQESASLLTPNRPGDGWKIVGAGDFNGDGQADFLFQHTDETLAVWFMQGTAMISASLLEPSRPGQPGWGAAGVADFNHDGQPDIMFQRAEGTLAVWYMNGTQLTQGALLPNQPSDSAWRLETLTDFDLDGKTDLLFQHSNGTLRIWYMNGIDLNRDEVSYPVASGWRVSGARDLNNDQNADLMFQHSSGAMGAWYMRGSLFLEATMLNPSQAGDGWQVVAITDDYSSPVLGASAKP